MAYYVKNETPKDVYVITTAKKRDSFDWQEDFNAYCKDLPFYIHSKLTVDSWNNIDKYAGVKDAFFIFDEQRLVGSGTWVKRFLKIVKSNNWILLSATPGDTWLDYIPVFVANGFYKNRTAFKDEHVIYNTFGPFPKVDRYVGQGKLIKHRSQILVKMPYVRHTTRHVHNIHVEYNEQLLKEATEKRWNIFTKEPMKDVSELFRVARRITNGDGSRLEAVRQLAKEHPRLIVFYNFDYELEELRTLGRSVPKTKHRKTVKSEGATDSSTSADSELMVAEWNGHKHDEVPETERWLYLVQYNAGSEGWNCITTDAMCFYSLTYSYKMWHQAFGRIDRLNTPFKDLHYYVLQSKSWIDQAVRRSLRDKKSFNEASSGFSI